MLLRRFGIEDATRLVVVHDELDLPPGVVRIKAGGGTAGHNGLRSIEAHLRTPTFLRVRIGIGKPPDPRSGSDHVLRRPARREHSVLQASTDLAADSVEVIATDGVDEAMNRFNGRGPVNAGSR